MKYITKLPLILLLISSFSIKAQTNRVEIEAKKVSDNYMVIPIGKEGIIMFYEEDERSKDGNKNWVFSKYNTDFKEVWTKEYAIDKSVNYIDFDSDAKNLYLFLGQQKSRGSSGQVNHKGEVQIVTLDYTAGTFKTFTNKIPTNSEIKYFNVVNNHAILSGINLPSTKHACAQGLLTCTCIPYFTQYTVFKFKPIVYNFNLGSTTSSAAKNTEFKGNTYVIGTEKNTINNGIDIAYKNREKYNKAPEVILKNYASDGKELGKIKLKGDGKNDIVSTRLLNLNAKEQILIGTFKKTPKLKKYFNPASNKAMSYGDEAEGMYFSKLEGGSQKFIKYYAFKDFNQFYVMITNGKKDQAIANADKNGVSHRLLVHDIIQKNDQYIMVAEAYYPEYETRSRYNAQTKRYETYQVFVGFRYTHALIAGFDKQGNKIWDNSFSIGSILDRGKLRERVRVLPFDDETILVFANGSTIVSKIISGNSVIDGNVSKVDTGLDGDKIKNSGMENNIQYWYDNYFISFGYQKIKSGEEGKKQGKDKKRRVYYFNKIAYQ